MNIDDKMKRAAVEQIANGGSLVLSVSQGGCDVFVLSLKGHAITIASPAIPGAAAAETVTLRIMGSAEDRVNALENLARVLTTGIAWQVTLSPP